MKKSTKLLSIITFLFSSFIFSATHVVFAADKAEEDKAAEVKEKSADTEKAAEGKSAEVKEKSADAEKAAEGESAKDGDKKKKGKGDEEPECE